ncbi:MAG TPA: hypothetical protein PLI65_08930, partial [Bacteroidales bacterium]|nr:hypothetical protein [Bacteroidales bacterium]
MVTFTGQASGQETDKSKLYNEKINQAEKFYFEKKYDQAKKIFQEAKKLRPDERHPSERISEINQILGIEEQEQPDVNREFLQALQKADALYEGKKWEEALNAYMAANDLMPGNDRITGRILEINRMLREQQAKETGYASAMKQAGQYAENNQPEKAREALEKALSFNPASKEAADKLGEINLIIRTKAEYEKALAEADTFYVKQDYPSAKAAYQRAQALQPQENYPRNMILRIDEMILKRENDALALEKNYQEALSQGDEHFADTKYALAKTFFEQAAALKPAESYPRARITEINNLLSDLEQLEQQFTKTIAAGDSLLAAKAWTEALTTFQSALKLKPESDYPIAKINEITVALAGIADEDYQRTINNANQLFEEKNYQQALIEFEKAAQLKPEENYPASKIAEINTILQGMAENDAAFQ